MSTINAASAAVGTEQIKEKIDELSERLDELLNASIKEDERVFNNLPYESIGGLFKVRGESLEKLVKQLGGGKVTAITQTHAIHGLGRHGWSLNLGVDC